MKKSILLIIFLIFNLPTHSQVIKTDSLQYKKNINYKSFIIPTILIGYGIVGLESHTLKNINTSAKNELNEHIDKTFTIDDISQYTPFISVYTLNNLGIKGENDLKNRTIILGTAYLIMGTTVNILKKTGNEIRPDGSSKNSFPSGHTATAFMGAEFLYQEYKNKSYWYGISGYLIATTTGFFRMYNDRHWLTDITAGAGIGILSTKIAYWLHPVIKKIFFKDNRNINAMALPFYNREASGLEVLITF